jgi:hypothetical protein
MARITPPVWKADDGSEQVTKLPSVTLLSTRIIPRANFAGVEVRYLLRSSRLQFKGFKSDPPITVGEKAVSTPAPSPVSREPRVLVDRYDGMATTTPIERGLELELSGEEKPFTATVEIAVFDRRDNGELTNRGDDSVQISFNL